MESIMSLSSVLMKRYATKKFDDNKVISNADMTIIKELLQLSPSSVNTQPWHFLITKNQETKKRISLATDANYSFNSDKILDASHVIVVCAKTDITEDYMSHLLEQESKDGRYSSDEFKEQANNARSFFVDLHRNKCKDLNHWLEKQVYLNIGSLLLGVATLGIDAVPMEGVDFTILNKEFSLEEKGLNSIAIISLGYKESNDFNASLPKSRLNQKEIITEI